MVNFEKLSNLLKPDYYKLFSNLARVKDGVKTLVNIRADILDILESKSSFIAFYFFFNYICLYIIISLSLSFSFSNWRELWARQWKRRKAKDHEFDTQKFALTLVHNWPFKHRANHLEFGCNSWYLFINFVCEVVNKLIYSISLFLFLFSSLKSRKSGPLRERAPGENAKRP